ncbi:hypothetical protein FCH28_24925 [Streptomyces piniterrae]|uniref:Uncharacterized protein n=1 Tax=Streptomyces piniterrae TaxID=2571125 RepID=A0A4U0NI53_9ACTN|nr:hypothetical protein [Streptomyces piniterrae]TJZ49544.1 hypothetical protein FCH28_24925 [Streptomyces piniterrae]
MNSAQQMTHAEHPSAEVVVEVDSCATHDAHAVFSALRTLFASDRAADDVPEEAPGPGATVWTATVDVTDLETEVAPRPLTEPVIVNIQGGYWAVARLREGLAAAFAVRVLGTAAGDQEQEVQLRLETRK